MNNSEIDNSERLLEFNSARKEIESIWEGKFDESQKSEKTVSLIETNYSAWLNRPFRINEINDKAYILLIERIRGLIEEGLTQFRRTQVLNRTEKYKNIISRILEINLNLEVELMKDLDSKRG